MVKLPGRGPQPVIEPDVKISMARQQIPFLLGEIGVSDRLTYTKLKSKLWIEKGRGLVWCRFYSAESPGEIGCCRQDRHRFCCHSQYCWFTRHFIWPCRTGKATSTVRTIRYHSHYKDHTATCTLLFPCFLICRIIRHGLDKITFPPNSNLHTRRLRFEFLQMTSHRESRAFQDHCPVHSLSWIWNHL